MTSHLQFSLDPYQDFGLSPDVADDYSDSDKLRLLADWFDAQDRLRGVTDDLMQRDLRRIADRLDPTDDRPGGTDG